jgi:exonuclease SbcD
MGHMLIEGAVIADGGGERRLQIGQNFAVKAAALPQDASMSPWAMCTSRSKSRRRPGRYAGSLLQLDFGEAEQERSVNVVELKPGLPPEVRRVAIKVDAPSRTSRPASRTSLQLAAAHGDAYLRVTVELDEFVPA